MHLIFNIDRLYLGTQTVDSGLLLEKLISDIFNDAQKTFKYQTL